MLVGALGLLHEAEEAESVDEAATLRNAALESLLIHARNVRDFFLGTTDPDDIDVRDFLTHLPEVAMPTLGSRDVGKRLNKMLSHPSFARPRLNPRWPTRGIVEDATEAFAAFLDALHREHPHRMEWFSRVHDRGFGLAA